MLSAAAAGSAVLVSTHCKPANPGKLLRPMLGPSRTGRYLDVQGFGARGDGHTDDTQAIQRAIDTIAAAGGGTVRLPAGTYVVARPVDTVVAVTLRSGVLLEGIGDKSVLKLRDGSGGHLLNAARVENCGVRDLVLDGNRDLQPSTGHGFRSGGVNGLLLENIIVKNAYHYAIGLQGGEHRDVLIKHVLIQDCGGDGIDIKNKSSTNGLVRLEDVTIRRWGLRKDRPTQAAIDCRGKVHLSNIKVANPGAEDAVGIRMRHGETSDVNGHGAHGSQLSNFAVRMGSGSAQVGVAVSARNVTLRNGAIHRGRRGLIIQDSGFRGSLLLVAACSEIGVLVDARNGSLAGDAASLSQCRVSGCGGNGFELEADDVQLVDCYSMNNGGLGLLIKDTAARTSILRGSYSANSRGAIIDRGPNSRVETRVP